MYIYIYIFFFLIVCLSYGFMLWIATLCCAGPDMVGGGCSCMLLLLPVLTSADDGPLHLAC